MTDPYAFGRFLCKQAETQAAKWQHDYASVALELARVKERLAEIESQQDPLNALIEREMGERERLYAAAFYVVVGRLPEEAPR